MINYKFFIIFLILEISLYAVGNKYREYTAKCMGTEFRILIDHDNEELSQNAADSAFGEANRLNQIFSDYIADSEISLLSESSFTGRKIKLSDELFEVLKYSKSLAIKTDNALTQRSDNYPDCGEFHVSEKVYLPKSLYIVL